MNKKTFYKEIASYIIKQFDSSNNVPYIKIINWIQQNPTMLSYMKKNNINNENITSIIKYDEKLLSIMAQLSLSNIMRNDKNFFYINNLLSQNELLELNNTNNNSQEITANNILNNLNLSDVNKFYCPYNKTIKDCKSTPKSNLNTQTLNKEDVLNVYLKNFDNIEKLCDYITTYYNSIISFTNTSIKIYNTKNIKLLSMSLKNNTFNIEFYDKILNGYIQYLKTIYPFNFFSYVDLIISFYIIFKSKDTNWKQYLNYLTYIHFENSKLFFIKKYFKDSKLNNIYDIFYKDKIDELVSNQVELILTFINHIELIPEDGNEFTSFIIGYYKLFIYTKNLLNWHIKKYANDYFLKMNTDNFHEMCESDFKFLKSVINI